MHAVSGAQRAPCLRVVARHVEILVGRRVDRVQPAIEDRHLSARAAAQQRHGRGQFGLVGAFAGAIEGDLRELGARGRDRREHGPLAVFAESLLQRREQRERRHRERHGAGEQQRGEHLGAQPQHLPAPALLAHGS